MLTDSMIDHNENDNIDFNLPQLKLNVGFHFDLNVSKTAFEKFKAIIPIIKAQ